MRQFDLQHFHIHYTSKITFASTVAGFGAHGTHAWASVHWTSEHSKHGNYEYTAMGIVLCVQFALRNHRKTIYQYG